MTTSPVVSITDELIAELEEIQKDASHVTREPDSQEYLGALATRLLNHVTDLITERADLRQQLSAASVDAERYRWLRDKAMTVKDVAPAILLVDDSCEPAVNATGWQSAISGADADVSVDAARNIGSGD